MRKPWWWTSAHEEDLSFWSERLPMLEIVKMVLVLVALVFCIIAAGNL
jgi:hypothetical protein